MNEDRAARYHRLKRRTDVLSLGLGVLLLLVLIVSGGSVALRDLVDTLTDGVPGFVRDTARVVAFVVGLALVSEAVSLPLGFYSGFVIERRYGLSKQSLGAWTIDQAKGLALTIVLGSIAAGVVYFFIGRSPGGWWLPAGVVFAVLVVGLANLGPVLVLPLFYRITPLNQESLRARLMTLAERAGARVLGIYEWGLGEKTTKANAALAGLGSSRRILVSDTMLADYTEDEIEVVLAHELAHHVHGDIWKGLVLESVLILAGCYAAARVLEEGAALAGLHGPADIAGLPLLLLGAGAVSLVMMPFAHALSRANERSADRFALTLTRNPGAFVSAMRRLGAQNLAEERPSRLVQFLFYSHPPLRERIAAAQAFKIQAS